MRRGVGDFTLTAAIDDFNVDAPAMGYYTRVLSQRTQRPTHQELEEILKAEHPGVRLSIDEGGGQSEPTRSLGS